MRRHKLNRFRKFELLEDRRMKAGDINFDSDTGTLTINGGSHNDQAYISFEGDEVHVDLDAGDSDGDPDHDDMDVDISDVSSIIFNGFAGNDTVNVDVNTLDSGVTLNFIGLEFHGGDDNDTLTQTGGGVFTWAYGEGGNDSLQGGRFTDLLEGGAGDDTLDGGANSDWYTFVGSNLGTDQVLEAANVDNDTLDFQHLDHGVTVDLAIASTSTTNPQYAVNSTDLKLKLSTDTGIEEVYGSGFDDVIRGNARNNDLNGEDGKDTLEGRGGNDSLSGGKKSDTYVFASNNLGTDSISENANIDNDALDFSGMTHGLRIELSKTGANNYAVNNTDLKLHLSNDTAIETVFGTDYEDVILGNSRDNYLYGRGGQDSLQGMAGVDELHGGADDDMLYVDSLDHAYGETGWDYFNGIKETANPSANPSPGRYMDWGRIFWAQL